MWFFKGEKPKGVFFWSNKKVNVFGALIDGKKLHYEFYDSMNTLTYKTFLSGLVKKLNKKKKYIFLLDNAPYHKSSIIMKYLADLDKNIFVEFFPPYSPELNPTETCWKIVRANVTNSTYFATIDDIEEAIDSFLYKHFFMLNLSNYLCR